MISPLRTVPIVVNNHISVKDASKYSGYSVQYLRRLLRSGGLQGLKMGQQWLIEIKDVTNMLGKASREGDRRFGPRSRAV